MSLAHHLRIFPYLEESLIECIYVPENEQMQKTRDTRETGGVNALGSNRYIDQQTWFSGRVI